MAVEARSPPPDPTSGRPLHGQASVIAANLALAAVHAATGALGLSEFAEAHPHVTLIWLPAGLSLGAVILRGPALLPGVFLGAALVGAASGAGLGEAAFSGLGGLAEAALGWAMLRRSGFSPRLEHPRDLVLLVLLGALAASLVGAAAGIGAPWLAGGAPPVGARPWWEAWLGHAGGVVALTPVLLLGAEGPPSWRALAARAESWAIAGLIAGTAFVVFSGEVSSFSARLIAAFLPYLALVWAGLRLGPRGAASAAALIAALAIAGRARGAGPLGDQAHIALLWAYLLTLSVTAVVLSTAVAQRDAADRARRAADQELRALEEQVRHARRLEGIALLAGGVAHDFNNLLFVIRANADLLDPVGPQVEQVAEIQAAARQATELCRQLLDFSGRSPPSLAPLDLGALVDETRALLRTRLPAAIRVEADLRPSPPVRADATRVRQAVMNLILNASEALGERGGSVRLTVGSTECPEGYLRQTFLHSEASPGPYVFLEVEDDGCGMDPDTLRRMFDPFFTTKPSGRGLGLMIVAGVARSHGGAIKVTSAPGEGSRFRLLLPLSGPASPPDSPR